VTDAPADNWAKTGDLLILADALAESVFKQARVERYERLGEIPSGALATLECTHPLSGFGGGYTFRVPLLSGDHVTDDTGTGFVHTAPSHGREDFDVWTANARELDARGINTTIPYTVDENGTYTEQAPGFTGRRVLTEKGEKGDANDAVIKALVEAGMLIARGRLKHQYPHSWRSKKPVIFRNTPQWFIAMDKDIADNGQAQRGDTLRARALHAISVTQWVPPSGQNRLNGMIVNRPDWVISRQRAWGVPIAVFVKEKGDGSVEILEDEAVNQRIVEAFMSEGADAWYAEGARERFLGSALAADSWAKVDDILDVWFDSGSTHAFVLEDKQHFPQLGTIVRKVDGGEDTVMYLEGSDQHRGWFHSSLLESCGTRGRAPYDVVLTHGFTLAEDGRKMSKSLGNTIEPQDVIKQSGADILRLWVCATDYADDQRVGPEILKNTVESYRKLRNTIRWMLGTLHHAKSGDTVAFEEMPELERLMLHQLAQLDAVVRPAYADFDYKTVVASVAAFMNAELSAFYFDIRKDALYCDPPSSTARKAALTTVDILCDTILKWLAPVLSFTCDEAWTNRNGNGDGAASVHLATFPTDLERYQNDALAKKWDRIRDVRRVVTGALEIERAAKRIGASLEASPIIYVADSALLGLLPDVDLAEVCITSNYEVQEGEAPAGAFTLSDVPGVAVVVELAVGTKCARSWRILPTVGADPEYPEVSPRDAKALREWRAMGIDVGRVAQPQPAAPATSTTLAVEQKLPVVDPAPPMQPAAPVADEDVQPAKQASAAKPIAVSEPKSRTRKPAAAKARAKAATAKKRRKKKARKATAKTTRAPAKKRAKKPAKRPAKTKGRAKTSKAVAKQARKRAAKAAKKTRRKVGSAAKTKTRKRASR
jgi:isoleucyl-tRNA synthetase